MNSRIVYTPREPKRSRRQFSRIHLWIAISAIATVLIVGGGIYVLRLPYFQIKQIQFSGLAVIDESELRSEIINLLAGNYLAVVPKRNILLIRPGVLESSLQKKFPRVKKISIQRVLPDTLRTSIEERTLWAILCNDLSGEQQAPSCVYLDSSGFAMEHSPQSTGSLITKVKTNISEINPGTQVFDPRLAEEMVTLAQGLKKSIGGEPTSYEFSVKLPEEIRVVMPEGFKIYFKRDDDFPHAFSVLKTVLEQEIKEKKSNLAYIDLRFGNKVFYKYK